MTQLAVQRLSCVVTRAKRIEHLQELVSPMPAQPNRDCIVVGCHGSDGAGGWVSENHPQASVTAIAQVPWPPLPKYLILGANVATNGWLAFLGTDILIEPRSAIGTGNSLQPQ